MKYYPLFINLTTASCLIVGAGDVGKRKLMSLLEAHPKEIWVLDSEPPTQELQKLLETSFIHFEQRQFQQNDIIGKSLVFAATTDPSVNAFIAECCKTQNVLCNIVDAPNKGTFIVPAYVEQGDISIAISTNGKSPALSRKLRKDITEWIGDRYLRMLTFLSRLRPLVLSSSQSTQKNTDLFRCLVYSDLTDALNQQNRHQCEYILQKNLPEHLQPYIMELLHELV